MQIERVIVGVKTLGPGNRLAIWVNGCHRRCPGCVSPRLRRFRVDHERDVKQLLGMLDLSGVDGVTVSGGEPFEQPDGIVEIAEFCKGRGIDDILVYSGYTLEQLRARRDKSTDDALAAISVLIDGEYVAELDDGEDNLAGSRNQRVIFLDERVRPTYEKYRKRERKMQQFRTDDKAIAVGIPDPEFIRSFKYDK